MGMETNKIELEFINSLKALMVRYGVSIEKGYVGFDDEVENTLLFSNDEVLREDEIYVDLNDFINYLNEK